jgi:hypothetical protein
MSFEGYFQFLCKNGHYETHSVYATDIEYWECSTCAEGASWWNIVDLTNGSYDDDGTRIDGYIYLKVLKEFNCVCDKCGDRHGYNAAIYEIPKDRGHLINEVS